MKELISEIALADTDDDGDIDIDEDAEEERAVELVNLERKKPITRRMKSAEILKNWNIMPLYATAALLSRFFFKAIAFPLFPLKVTRLFGFPRLSRKVSAWDGTGDYAESMKTAEEMQEKWKVSESQRAKKSNNILKKAKTN